MRSREWVPAALATVVAVVAGCRGGTGSAREAGLASPVPGPTPAAAVRHFEPPPDGRLTAAQVEMYIEVGRKARAHREAASVGVPATLVDLAAAGPRAAAELGRDVDEYRWVSARIAETSPAAPEGLGSIAESIEAAAVAGRDRVVEKGADQRAPAKPGDAGADAAGRAYNRQLLERYRSELDALRQPASFRSPPAGPPRG
jgi:hypothetical protein